MLQTAVEDVPRDPLLGETYLRNPSLRSGRLWQERRPAQPEGTCAVGCARLQQVILIDVSVNLLVVPAYYT